MELAWTYMEKNIDDSIATQVLYTVDSTRPQRKRESQECVKRAFEDKNVDSELQAQGQHWPAKHFLRTVYHQIWPLLT